MRIAINIINFIFNRRSKNTLRYYIKFTTGIESITQINVLELTVRQVIKLGVLNQSSMDIKLETGPGIYIIELFNGQRFIYRKILNQAGYQ